MTRRLLVIDWDWFFPIEEIEGGGKLWPLYDWVHSENFASALNVKLWTIRAADFVRNDLPLPGTSGLEVDFWKRFRFDQHASLIVGDSNTYAASDEVIKKTLANNNERVEVVLFDAHHDCGYHGTYEDLIESGKVDCGNWMCFYYKAGAKLSVRYPAWRHYFEEVEPTTLIPVDRRVDDGASLGKTFHAVYICRSGAWTPPWIDEDFVRFVQACPAKRRYTLDDCLRPRPFRMADVEANIALTATEEVVDAQ